MQTLLSILSYAPPLIFGVGTVITILALRRAPEGNEDGEGFHYRHPFAIPRPRVARAKHSSDTMPPMGNGTRFA